MDNLGILVQAILSLKDTKASKDQIVDDLPALEHKLQSDKGARVKIIAKLDVDKSKAVIQSQLNTLANQAKAPTVKIGIDIAGTNNKNGQPVIKPILDRSVYKDIDSYINAISAKLSQSKIGDISSITKGIKESLGANSPEVKSAVAELVNALKLTPNNQKAITDSYSNLIESIRGTISSGKIVGDANFEKNLADEIYRISTSYAIVQAQAQQTSNVVANANANIGNSARTISTQYRTEFGVVTDVIKQAETEFARFGEVSAVSNKSVKAFEGVPEHFKDFTIQVKSATGTVQKFFYTFENVGDKDNPVFKYMLQNINEADAGVKRLADDIEKAKAQYTSKLAGFESTNSQIKTGLSAEIAKVNDEINKLGTNNGSIQNLKVAFDNLTASANKIKENLKATGASLNPIDNAINKYKNMDNVLKEITTSFNNLAIKPTGLGDSLNSVKSQLIELQNLEKSEGGYTEAWAKKYRDVSLAIAEVKTNIELALKAEKSDKGSSYQTQLKYLNKIKEETNTIISLKRKMVNAGDEEKAVYQHEITNAQKRIQYDVQQLDKKKLLTDEAKRLVNTYKEQIALQDKINSAKTSDKNVQAQSQQLKDYVTQVSKAITLLNSLQNSSTFTKNASDTKVIQTKQEITQLLAEYQNLKTQMQGNITPAGLESIGNQLTQLNARFNTTTTTAQRFESELKSDNGAEKLAQRVALLKAQLEALAKANPKALKRFGDEINSLMATLNNSPDGKAVEQVAKDIQILRKEINNADLAGKTFFQKLKDNASKFAGWMTLTGIISGLWREMRQMVTNVIELDKAMTNLKKVTDETETVYSRFLKNASQQAKEFHSTVTDLIEQTSQWAKLGYNLEQANKLAKASMIYANVGEVDNEQAVTNIVSAVKAFDIAVDDIMSIPDVYNKLGNEFAVSSKNLGIGMSQAATTMALAGNDFNQVAALLTGAGEILGDNKLDEIGNGLKTVTLRIQNQAGALKELGEEYEDLVSVSKTQQQVYELTGGKVNIMSATDPNEFRDTYNILKDVANVINDLNGTDASELVQLLFGKNRANVGTAILKAFQSGQIEKAYEAAKNSAGSAQKEFDSWSQSIEAHINTFKASFESLSNTVINSDLIKSLIDSGTTFLNILEKIIDKFGTIPTLLGSIATVGAFKNVGELLNTPVYVQPQHICA